jgi:branched-subunit amino acid transport protein
LENQAPLIIAAVVAGLLTFAIRASFIVVWDKAVLPGWFRQALKHVPVAVFTAIIAPELLSVGASGIVWGGWPKGAAAVAAILVAWRSRSIVMTLAAGLVVLWGVQALVTGA